jgi:hypothetical protein
VLHFRYEKPDDPHISRQLIHGGQRIKGGWNRLEGYRKISFLSLLVHDQWGKCLSWSN